MTTAKPGYQEIISGADYSAGAIVPVKLTDQERKLTVDCFYWVMVRFNGTGAVTWEPARFTGIDFSHRPTWDYIGQESASGHHHVEVIDVGDVIIRSESPE